MSIRALPAVFLSVPFCWRSESTRITFYKNGHFWSLLIYLLAKVTHPQPTQPNPAFRKLANMKKFLIFPSHPHSQNYTVSPNSRTVSQGHFQRSNQHFIADFFFPRQTFYASAVSLIWGKLQKLGYHCLYFLSALFRKPDILALKLLKCKASALTLLEGRTCPRQLLVPAGGGSCNSQFPPCWPHQPSLEVDGFCPAEFAASSTEMH